MESVAYAAAFNPNGIKIFLANGLSAFPIKFNPLLSNGHKIIPKNLPDCLILSHWVYDNFALIYERFAKALVASKL